MNEIIIALIGVFSTLISSLIGYRTGKRGREKDADKTAFENYNYAIESLRKEFDRQIECLRKENNELRERIRILEEEKKK